MEHPGRQAGGGGDGGGGGKGGEGREDEKAPGIWKNGWVKITLEYFPYQVLSRVLSHLRHEWHVIRTRTALKKTMHVLCTGGSVALDRDGVSN